MHAADDKAKKESVEARNQADGLVYSTEKNLAEYGDKIPAEDKAEIEEAVAAVKTALEGEDVEDIKAKTEALGQAAMKLGEAMYKAQQEEAAGDAGFADAADAGPGADDTASGPNDDNIVDADFEEVDDDERKDKSA